MYDSNNQSISIDQQTRDHRTEVLCRLYGMGFNLIPMNGKKPCVEWKAFQTERVSLEKLKEWMRGKFPTKDGKTLWNPEILNFALITGATPWSSTDPGIIVVDSDDEEAETLVKERCPETPMMQVTGSGGFHRVYRRPDFHFSNRQKTWSGGKEYGVDIRGDGGYIMAPGSIHPKTQHLYREIEPWTLDLLKQCPVYDPDWLPCERSQPKRTTSVAVTAPKRKLARYLHQASTLNIKTHEYGNGPRECLVLPVIHWGLMKQIDDEPLLKEVPMSDWWEIEDGDE